MDEGEVVVRADLLLARQALFERALQVLRGVVVFAAVVWLEPHEERGLAFARCLGILRRARLERSEDRPPDGMACLGGGKLEPRVYGERLAELVPALALAAGRAIDEGEILVGPCEVLVGEALVDRGAQVLGGAGVLAFLVLFHPGGEGRLAFARLEQVLHFRLHVAHGLARASAKERDRRDAEQDSQHQRNLCFIFAVSPVLITTRSTKGGKSELWITIVCEPAEISSLRSGGLKPRSCPSTNTLPPRVIASSKPPASPRAAFFCRFFSAGVFSMLAMLSFLGETAGLSADLGAAAGGAGSAEASLAGLVPGFAGAAAVSAAEGLSTPRPLRGTSNGRTAQAPAGDAENRRCPA